MFGSCALLILMQLKSMLLFNKNEFGVSKDQVFTTAFSSSEFIKRNAFRQGSFVKVTFNFVFSFGIANINVTRFCIWCVQNQNIYSLSSSTSCIAETVKIYLSNYTKWIEMTHLFCSKRALYVVKHFTCAYWFMHAAKYDVTLTIHRNFFLIQLRNIATVSNRWFGLSYIFVALKKCHKIVGKTFLLIQTSCKSSGPLELISWGCENILYHL